jgi:hypothetical protein
MRRVRCIRLDTGEVLIGFVERKWNGDYVISEAQVCLMEVKEGTMEVNMAPWIPFAKEYTFTINAGLIQTVFDAKPQLETNFKVSTGNNFQQRGKVAK